MADLPEPNTQTSAVPGRRMSFAERLKPQAMTLDDVPEPPASIEADVEEGDLADDLEEFGVETGNTESVTPMQVTPASVTPPAEVSPEAPVAHAVQEERTASEPAGPGAEASAAEATEKQSAGAEPPVFRAPDLPVTVSEFSLRQPAPLDVSEVLPNLPALLPGNPAAELQSDAEMKHDTVLRMIDETMNSISCGDDLHIPERPKKTLEEELADLGFPPRPHLWPPMMSWPQLRDLDLLRQKGLTAELLQDYLKAQEIRQAKMLDRAATMDEWIRTHNPKKGFWFKPVIALKKSQPYRGVNWACLLDEDLAQNQLLSRVYSWGHMRARTADGGEVHAFHSHVKVKTTSVDAVRMAVLEARARGWKTLRITGDAEFTKHAIEICRQANIAAEITVRATPLSPHRRRYHMTPSLPGATTAPQSGQQGEGLSLPVDGFMAPKQIAGQARLTEVSAEDKKPAMAIPAQGIDAMPRSPFPSGLAREGAPEEDLFSDLEEATSKGKASGKGVSDRLVFGAPLGGVGPDPVTAKTVSAEKKSEDPQLES